MVLKKKVDKEYWDSLMRASLLGIHLVATTFIGLAIGYFLDIWLETKPWLTLIFLVLGIAAGFKNMFAEVKKIQKSDEQASKKK
ncbi:MAG: AtpZ/AtpI family protein [Desulfovermiculus sp.]|nr:AtpZ/AtpI family protein [Desulfovermiculus sp.]